MKDIFSCYEDIKGMSDSEIVNFISDKITEAQIYVFLYSQKPGNSGTDKIFEIARAKEREFANPVKLKMQMFFGTKDF